MGLICSRTPLRLDLLGYTFQKQVLSGGLHAVLYSEILPRSYGAILCGRKLEVYAEPLIQVPFCRNLGVTFYGDVVGPDKYEKTGDRWDHLRLYHHSDSNIVCVALKLHQYGIFRSCRCFHTANVG